MTTSAEPIAPPASAPVPTLKFPPAAPLLPVPVQPAPQTAVAPPTPVPVPPGLPGWVAPALIIGIGLLVGVAALVLWRRSRRIAPEEIFRVLDIDPASAGTEHVEFPPIDLHQPIFGEAAWRAIRTHADDAAYLSAVEVVRQRHGDTGHPMALATLLRETMAAERIGFREAILRLGDDTDEGEDPDAPWRGPVLDEEGRLVEPEAPEAEAIKPDMPRQGAVPGGDRIFDVEDEFVPGPLAAAPRADEDGQAARIAATQGWVVDLTRPVGRAEWATILADAEREGYRDAAQAVQALYRTVIDRMLLPNTLRHLMEREGLGFAAAMVRAAQADPMPPRGPRA